jgi:hypothetical protein
MRSDQGKAFTVEGMEMSKKKIGGNLALMLISFGVLAWGPLPPQDAAASDLLALPPYVAVPTESSVLMNLVAGDRDFSCRIRFHRADSGGQTWLFSDPVDMKRGDVTGLRLTGLEGGARYVYDVMASPARGEAEQTVASGGFKTRVMRAEKFSFALFSDSHITPLAPDRNAVLNRVANTIAFRKPDFSLALGDNIQVLSQTHAGPFVNPEHPRVSYSLYRQALGRLASETSIFNVLGNWEGENGWHPQQARAWARETRMRMAPAPGAQSYPEGGSPDEDYYAFTWGDVLCVVLNVTGYTPADHALGSMVGKTDDWTLGERQMAWLAECLGSSHAKWKLLFIHHTVGGRAGDDLNSRYGRGGGRAANVGEQQQVHALMLKYGVQAFFYGHDHVFTIQEADGIPYICVGSAGAPWKFTGAETGYPWNVPDSGFTWIDVDGKRLSVSYVIPDATAEGGRELKRYEIEQAKPR